MSGEFAGRRAFVTGGTSGIGAATAVLLAELGAHVTALGLPPADPTDLPDHPRVHVVEHDVLDRAGLVGLLSDDQPLDALVNCAGVSHDRGEYDLARWQRVIDINLTATMVACQAARPALAVSGGAIVNVSSMFSFFGSRDRPAYSASKGGVSQLTKSLAAEYAADGVRVNAVAPGFVVTPLARGCSTTPRPRPGFWPASRPGASVSRARSPRWWRSCARRRPRTSPARSFPWTGATWPCDGRLR